MLVILFQAHAAAAAPPASPRDKQVDAAVAKALRFLAKEQLPSGAWKVDTYGESTAATSLAVMAYMAAGHVPGEGPYAEPIERGVKYVLAHQQPNGMIVHNSSHGPFYCHGISTLMLAEVFGMLQEPLASDCRAALEKAVAVTLRAQSVEKPEKHAGGWRYQPTSLDSDLSVTGWQLLALRAAKNVGCDVPAEAIDKAVAYVKTCSSEKLGAFAYQPGGHCTATRTGTGILALEVCGTHRSDQAMRGARFLVSKPLDLQETYFFYGAYYCAVGLFKLDEPEWDAARRQIVDLVLTLQQPDGSWLAPHGGEHSAGKVYCTTMAVLALAVDYQYLPIYQR
jgi:hypothetical protein